MVNLKRSLQEFLSLSGDVRWDGWAGKGSNLPGHETRGLASARAAGTKLKRRRSITHLEDGLHLRELRPGVLAGEHLNDKAAHAPDVCFLGMPSLFHHFRGHPEDRSLERWTVHSVSDEEIYLIGMCQKRTRMNG